MGAMVGQGALIGGRYQLQREIASGGMGQVWSAHDQILGRRVAVKTVKPALVGDQEFADRFRREARLAATLNHPRIAQVHDFGEGPDGAFLVMELVDGHPLSGLIADRRLSGEQLLDVLAQAADALQSAHERGVVHRDVKPANILVTGVGEVKLTDFGIARALSDARVTRAGEVLGTAHYLSPEAALGREVGTASDIYSLGVVAYEGLSGVPPFDADSAIGIAMKHVSEPPPPLPPGVPPPVRDVVLRSLEKDPARRQQSAGELAHHLRSVAPYARAVVAQGHPAASQPSGPQPWPRGSAPAQPTPPPRSDPRMGSGPSTPPPYAGHLAAAPLKSRGSTTSVAIAATWMIAAVLCGMALVLPFATLDGASYTGFGLTPVEQSYKPSAGGDTAVGVVQLILCLVLAALAVPGMLRAGHRGWSICALIVAFVGGFVWIGLAGIITGDDDGAHSRASLAWGWGVHGALGLICFGFVIAGIVRPR